MKPKQLFIRQLADTWRIGYWDSNRIRPSDRAFRCVASYHSHEQADRMAVVIAKHNTGFIYAKKSNIRNADRR